MALDFRNYRPARRWTRCANSVRRSRADYQEKLKTFKPEYSAMVQLKAKIDEVDREISPKTPAR